MDLSPHDLDRVRDYVGDTPDDTTVYLYAEDATWWQEIALRILQRRRANAAAGGAQAKTFSLDGVLSVGLATTDVAALTAQIDDLAQQIATLHGAPGPVSVGRIRRPDRYR